MTATRAQRYAAIGALAGLGLPVLATLIEAGRLHVPLADAYARSPLLWIIATAPLVVAFLLGLVGHRQDALLAFERARREAAHRTADELSATAHALLGAVTAFSSVTAQTAASIKETTATMASLSQTATKAALTAETVIGLARKSAASSQEGLGAVEVTCSGMVGLAADVRGLSDKVAALGTRMNEIQAAAAKVGDVAEGTQRLAAEVAEEAARARAATFAPLAERLRAHADEARRAAGDVRGRLGDGHEAMLVALTAVEAGTRRAESGAEVAASTGDAIRRLASTIRESSDAARQIATVAQQQDRGIDEVLEAMNQIFLAIQEGQVATENVAARARALDELALALKRQVEG